MKKHTKPYRYNFATMDHIPFPIGYYWLLISLTAVTRENKEKSDYV